MHSALDIPGRSSLKMDLLIYFVYLGLFKEENGLFDGMLQSA